MVGDVDRAQAFYEECDSPEYLDRLAVEVDMYVAKCLVNPPGRATSNKEP